MQKLSGKSLLLVSFTLFSMFFGAGNLIFPPHLGAQPVPASGLPLRALPSAPSACPLRAWWLWHGQAVWISLPAGCIRCSPWCSPFWCIFPLARACHSPHGKHLVPDAGAADRRRYRAAAGLLGAVFCSGLSGGAAAGKAYRLAGPHPLPLPDRAHRGAVCRVSHPSAGGTLRHTQRRVRSPAAVQGILYGYQTMDTLAGLNFGAVIALNIRARGVTESRAVEGGTSGPVLLQAG